jgi:hypothetical protein
MLRSWLIWKERLIPLKLLWKSYGNVEFHSSFEGIDLFVLYSSNSLFYIELIYCFLLQKVTWWILWRLVCRRVDYWLVCCLEINFCTALVNRKNCFLPQTRLSNMGTHSEKKTQLFQNEKQSLLFALDQIDPRYLIKPNKVRNPKKLTRTDYCHYYIPKKKRFCQVRPKSGFCLCCWKFFCENDLFHSITNHFHQNKQNKTGAKYCPNHMAVCHGQVRVPCPHDPRQYVSSSHNCTLHIYHRCVWFIPLVLFIKIVWKNTSRNACLQNLNHTFKLISMQEAGNQLIYSFFIHWAKVQR